MKTVLKLVVTALAGAGVLFSGLASAVAVEGVLPGLGIRLAEAPSSRSDDPRAQIYIVDHVAPGTTFERRVEISNGYEEAINVLVYPLSASIRGDAWVPAVGRGENALTDWMRVSPGRISLSPGERQQVTAQFDIPTDAAEGEYYALVAAELPPPRDQQGDGVTVGSRVGIRVYLSVGPGAEPPSDFEISSLQASRDAAGRPQVRATVTNTGGRALDISGELHLAEGPAGLTAGPFPADLGTTLGPGDTGDVVVHLAPELPSGPWLARLVARSGRLEKAAEATIVFPDVAGESADPVEATEVPLLRDRGFLLPLAIALVIVVLIGLVLFWWFVVRDRAAAAGQKAASKVKAGK